MSAIFTIYIYQPFLNILVGIYWLLGQITNGQPDIGIAVIIFSVIVRIIMLPLNLSADKSEKEKREIMKKINQIEAKYKGQPAVLKQETKKILKSNPGTLISEGFTLTIQIIIVLMLYRIFKTGLEGADLHLLYPFLPAVDTPINLIFLNQYDLSVPNMFLNLVQSALIFVVEILHMLFSPIKSSRKEFLSLAIFLPVISFILFAMLPAGKKVFIITSLIFSIFLLVIKQVIFWYHSFLGSPSAKS
ncbi:YidC/Oxa1 family membrane protein insertase [Patescibacteria group bacterium]|nr:YidC/Oxa1 family membrane protein insertase [Patescibacteria group bacterium]